MPYICEIKLSTSDAIALLAMFVAALSALYARWSWKEAVKSNQISLLGHRKEIHDAFFALKTHMLQKSAFAEMQEVSKFYCAAKNAQIYLPDKLAESIGLYFNTCFLIAEIHQKNGGITKDGGEECKAHITTERRLAPKIESEITALMKKSQA